MKTSQKKDKMTYDLCFQSRHSRKFGTLTLEHRTSLACNRMYYSCKLNTTHSILPTKINIGDQKRQAGQKRSKLSIKISKNQI